MGEDWKLKTPAAAGDLTSNSSQVKNSIAGTAPSPGTSEPAPGGGGEDLVRGAPRVGEAGL